MLRAGVVLIAILLSGVETVKPETASSGPPTTKAAAENDGRHDFDFLFGRFKIKNRRLVARLQGSTEWEEFEATNEAHPLPTGLGNEDVYRTDYWPGFVGMTFRFFDPESRSWSLYWVENRTGILQPPVIGSFKGDVGVFKGPDIFHGRPIIVRYIWSSPTAGRPRWEQAFSADEGKTWETNWVMEFTRVGEDR
jgi:hypothetical protein